MNKSDLNLEISIARSFHNNDGLPAIDANGIYSESFLALELLLQRRRVKTQLEQLKTENDKARELFTVGNTGSVKDSEGNYLESYINYGITNKAYRAALRAAK
jgi:hypothetical protein